MTTDADAQFDTWVAQQWPALVRYAFGVTGNRDDALDAVQDALANILPRWTSLDPDRAERYVKRTIANTAISTWRKTGQRLHLVAEVADTPTTEPAFDQRLVDADLARRLCERLPPDQRAAVVLRYANDLSFAEIADILDCREATARSHVHRALTALRADLNKSAALNKSADVNDSADLDHSAHLNTSIGSGRITIPDSSSASGRQFPQGG